MAIYEIKGSKSFYTVNLDVVTCNCRDFTYRKCHYQVGNPNRLCKHLSEAIGLDSSLSSIPTSDTIRDYSNLSSIQRLISATKKSIESLIDDDLLLLGTVGVPNHNVLPIILYTYADPSDENMKSAVHSVLYSRVLGNDSSISLVSCNNESGRFRIGGDAVVLRILDPYPYGYSSLFITSSREFLVKLSSIALSKKLSLSPYGLYTLHPGNELYNEDWTDYEIIKSLGLDPSLPRI